MSDAQDLKTRLDAVRAESIERIEQAEDLNALEEARIRILGRKAPMSAIRAGLGKLPDAERRTAGQLVNEVQSAIEAALDSRRAVLEEAEMAARWERERIDVTLSGAGPELETQTMANLGRFIFIR